MRVGVLVDKFLEDDFVAFDLFVGLGFELLHLVLRLRVSELPLHLVQEFFKFGDFFLSEGEVPL